MSSRGMFVLPVFLLLCSCVAPGSALTRVSVSGQVRSTSDAPVSMEKLVIGLPAGYGLAGLDASMGKPEMYGHRTQKLSVSTNEEGSFSVSFKPVTYSVSVWIIPPLGAFPRRPPPPLIWVKILSKPKELYAIYETGDGLKFQIFDEQTKEAIAESKEGLADIRGVVMKDDNDKMKGTKLELKVLVK